MRRSWGTAATALAIAVLASACGSEVPSPGAQSSTQSVPGSTAVDQQVGRNEQDVVFARQTIPPLLQTRDLAKFVPERSTNSAVLDLAARIKRSQNPDIQQLLAWLYLWDEEYVHSTDNEAVQKLQQADDAQFDRMWTQMTIERHQRVIALAKTELDIGKHLAVMQFAQRIIDSRQAEIGELQKLAQP
jgi:uncharacterized protein (DUF305 family)